MDSAKSRSLRLKTQIFSVIVVLSNALGNFALTWGLRHRAEPLTLSPVSYIQAIFSPYVALGVSLLILWLLSRMAFLSWADLSYVLPVTSMGYVLSAFIGRFFLGEQISWQRWLGTSLIIAGTVLVGLTTPRTAPAVHMEGI